MREVYGAEAENPVKTGWFVQKIMLQMNPEQEFLGEECLISMERGVRQGWLEPMDVLQMDSPLEKRVAARIVHQFLRLVLRERDEDDWSAAGGLKDLYDCRTCVNHVAQVFCKGIMEGEEKNSVTVFGMRSFLTKQQALRIVERMFHVSGRLSVSGRRAAIQPAHIAVAEAENLMRSYGETGQVFRLLDVRSRMEYERGHWEGAEGFPMTEILERPELLGEDKMLPVLIYCDRGYRSEIVAGCLCESGYAKVFYFEAM